MKQIGIKQIFFVILVCFVMLPNSGCAMQDLSSKWRDHAVQIDGRDTEWKEVATYYDNDSHVVMGFINDENNLYVRFSSSDRNVQSNLLRRGCTVWFNTEGGKDKTFGIHFPIGIKGRAQGMARQGNERPTKDIIEETLKDSQELVEIIGPGQDQRSILNMTDAQKIGVEVQIDIQKGFLVYELKVPFDRMTNKPNSIGVDLLKTISVGFETEKSKRTATKRDRGQGRGGRGDHSDGRRGGQQPESLEIWIKVNLSDK